jgi:hypothetical protein
MAYRISNRVVISRRALSVGRGGSGATVERGSLPGVTSTRRPQLRNSVTAHAPESVCVAGLLTSCGLILLAALRIVARPAPTGIVAYGPALVVGTACSIAITA